MATQRIREFSEGVQYVLGDVALYNDAASSTTIVKRCKKNTPIGEFQANDWEDIFSFPTSKKNLQGVINTAERITTQTLLYGERMSRVTAIPHLIPQTKMVKVMQALEKRAPRSTENLGGKEYKLRGNIYTSMDRKSSDGKDVTDVGYVGVCGTENDKYGSIGRVLAPSSIDDIVEFSKSKTVISADLPFIHSWAYFCCGVSSFFYEGNPPSTPPQSNDCVYIGISHLDARPFAYANMLNNDRLKIASDVIERRQYTPLYSYTDTDRLISSVHIHKYTYSNYMTLEQILKTPAPVGKIREISVGSVCLVQNFTDDVTYGCDVTPTISWGGIDDRVKGRQFMANEQLTTPYGLAIRIDSGVWEFNKNVSFNWFKLSYIFH